VFGLMMTVWGRGGVSGSVIERKCSSMARKGSVGGVPASASSVARRSLVFMREVPRARAGVSTAASMRVLSSTGAIHEQRIREAFEAATGQHRRRLNRRHGTSLAW
jgi:hypothetical protein